MRYGVCLMVIWSLACASQSDQMAVAQARDKLRDALNRPVHTRDERDDQYRSSKHVYVSLLGGM